MTKEEAPTVIKADANVDANKNSNATANKKIAWEPAARCRYEVVLTDNDMARALLAYEKGDYCMGYIDALHFKIVKDYLNHLPGTEYDTSKIFNPGTMGHIIENDWYLRHIGPEGIIGSFNEVLDFIGSINRKAD